MPFGEWLKSTRARTRLSQDRLALKANEVCTGSYISTLERGQDIGKKGAPVRPSEEIVEGLATALADELGVPRDFLIAEARKAAGYSVLDKESPSDERAEFKVQFYHLEEIPPERRAYLKEYVETLLEIELHKIRKAEGRD